MRDVDCVCIISRCVDDSVRYSAVYASGFSTSVQTDSGRLYGLRFLSAEGHEHKLYAVDADVEQRSSSQLFLNGARHMCERNAEIRSHHLQLAHLAPRQQTTDLQRRREEPRPDGLQNKHRTEIYM